MKLPELDQMLCAPSDAWSAGLWCEAANDLRGLLAAAEARADQWKAAFGIKHGLDDPEVASEYVKALIENEFEAHERAEKYQEALEEILDAWEAWDGEDEGLDNACGQLYRLLDVSLSLPDPRQERDAE